MTDADLIRSIGLRTEVIAHFMGISPQRVRTWASYGIPASRRQDVLDLKESVRQILDERGKTCTR